MNCSKRSFFIVSALFALLLLSGTGTLNARDADLDPLILVAAQTANQQCINSCRARYCDCRSVGGTRIAPDTIAVLVQLVDRLGQGFRGN